MIRMAYASLARSRISFCAAHRNAVLSSEVVRTPPVILQRKTPGDNAAGHVLVNTGPSDGIHLEAGFQPTALIQFCGLPVPPENLGDSLRPAVFWQIANP